MKKKGETYIGQILLDLPEHLDVEVARILVHTLHEVGAGVRSQLQLAAQFVVVCWALAVVADA